MQVGLNGVDNGSIRFTGVRIPVDNLLDRFGQVDNQGKYTSRLSASKRFAATLGELTGGRVGLTCASVGILKVSLSPSLSHPPSRCHATADNRGSHTLNWLARLLTWHCGSDAVHTEHQGSVLKVVCCAYQISGYSMRSRSEVRAGLPDSSSEIRSD